MNKGKCPTVYFSNRFEKLAESLAEELWKKGQDPFAKRTVILPHHGLKSYLTSFFAKHPNLNISAGVEFKSLLEGVHNLLPKEKKIPSEVAISFAVEQEIELLLTQEPFPEDFSSVKEYVGHDNSFKKIEWMAKELAKIFYEYAVFEPKALLNFLSQKGWKQEIWKRIFSKFLHWTSLSEALLIKKQEEEVFHLFGFSHMPSHFYDFFCKFSTKFYFLSPTEMFWEDLCSDRERIYLEKRMEKGKVRLHVQEQLRFFLTKTHPLLANWGKTGRKLLSKFGQLEAYLEERYEEEFEENALGQVQKSLLELEDEEIKKEVLEEDLSLLCISAPSKLREVEVLEQTVQEIIQELKIEPKDVLVLVPDLKGYLPYIHAIFGRKESFFAYSIHGLFSSKDPQEGVLAFLSMVEDRFSLQSVHDFFSMPAVRDKWGFSEKDLKVFYQWFEKAHVLWGLDLEHKKFCLEKTSPSKEVQVPEGGTWEEGIQRLLEFLSKEESSFSIDWTQAELLGKFIHLIKKMQSDLRPLYLEEKKTFSDWTSFLEKWLETFFVMGNEEEALLLDLRLLEQDLKDSTKVGFLFDSFARAIHSHYKKRKESFQSGTLQAIKFLSLEMDGIYPAKLIYVLGCDEESLPKPQKISCMSGEAKFKESPSFAEESRYTFLQLLLHARSSLVLSYPRISSQDQKVQGPCRMIEELFDFLDKRFYFKKSGKKPSGIWMRNHPSMNFSKEYFQEKGLKNFSSSSFSFSKNYYLEEKKSIPPFFPSWQKIVEKKGEMEKKSIDLRKIQDFSKNPVRFYFKEKLGIFFDFSSNEDKEFFLSPLAQRKLSKQALTKELTFEGLPLGVLGKTAVKDLQEEAREWKGALQAFHLVEKDIFFVELVEGIRSAKKQKEKILCPALQIEVEGVGTVSLTGSLSHITEKGMLWFGKSKEEEHIILWPSFLIYLCLAKTFGWEESCLFIQEGKRFSLCPKDPYQALRDYLELYFHSLQEPCPIHPKAALQLLQDDEEGLKKIFSPSFDIGFSDPYESWIKKRDPPLAHLHIQDRWKSHWNKAFSSFIQTGEKHADV